VLRLTREESGEEISFKILKEEEMKARSRSL
jgi:hypothetical protein